MVSRDPVNTATSVINLAPAGYVILRGSDLMVAPHFLFRTGPETETNPANRDLLDPDLFYWLTFDEIAKDCLIRVVEGGFYHRQDAVNDAWEDSGYLTL